MNTSNITKSGLFLALSILIIYLSSIIPNNKAFLLFGASLLIPLCAIVTNLKYALMTYLSASILSLSLFGPFLTVLAYILFFGLYGIIKFYIEKINKISIEIILKLLYFNITLFSSYYIYKLIIFHNFNLKYKPIIFIIFQFLFLFYDYILSIFIVYLVKKLNHLNKKH